VKLGFEWLEAPGVKDPAEAATWADFEFELAGVLVSELLDERQRTVRSRYAGSALTLAEWLLDAWARLVHERRRPIRDTDEWWDWRGFHRFRTGRHGGAMPNLELVRFSDDTVEVRAFADEGPLAPGMTVRFLKSARARVPLQTVLLELDRFLQAVATRLWGVDTPRAQAFRAALARRAESAEAALAGRLGLTGGPRGPVFDAVVSSPQRESLAAVIEASAAPSLEQRLAEAQGVVTRLPRAPEPDARWRRLEEALGSLAPGEEAWLTGWAAAERFRAAIDLPATEPVSSEVLRARCGWDAWACVHTAETLATGVDAVHVRAPGGPPGLVTTWTTRPAQTFRIARSLYHGLFGGAATVVADSRLLGSRFSEANAFAAELVAPVERLKQLAPASHVWETEHLDAAAAALGVNRQVVRHQVENREGLGVLGLAG
jgi:hypothetical protein